MSAHLERLRAFLSSKVDPDLRLPLLACLDALELADTALDGLIPNLLDMSAEDAAVYADDVAAFEAVRSAIEGEDVDAADSRAGPLPADVCAFCFELRDSATGRCLQPFHKGSTE